MNKFINVILLFLAIPTMVLSIFVGMNLPIEFLKTSGAQLPYSFEIFLTLGILFFVIILRRSVRRWMGVKMVSNTEKYKWNEAMGEDRKKRVYLYQSLEALLMTFAALSLYTVCKDAWLPACAFMFGAIDNIIFMFMGMQKNIYRIGLTSKAIVVADRDVKVVYFSGLRKVTIHQQTVFFDYIKDLQCTFPLNCIDEKDRTNFKNSLEAQLDREKVFFSDSIKNM